MSKATLKKKTPTLSKETALKGFELMATARAMSDIYEENAKLTSKYVHATSRGHEAIQLALGMQLKPQDWVAPYYRDDSILLGIGMTPCELMLQVFAKKDDPFSGGRTYYSHPSLRRDDMPKIPHQSSATGMQAIPTTGVAMGIQYLEEKGLGKDFGNEKPIVVCSLGDASVTEGEVSEAFHMATLKQMPILFLVQDNEWDISAHADEIRANDVSYYARGFKGLDCVTILGGNDFEKCYTQLEQVISTMRAERRPFIVHAKVPLLGHHTSGVRKEWYRHDLKEHEKRDPYPLFFNHLKTDGISEKELLQLERKVCRRRISDCRKRGGA